ncbi:7,8-didemethyl-8-hydroxy-5-deazariboflavin synthase subunit CofH [Salinarchaeum sp. IM2453]|uniref:7,8-didemethyl-8-hydroxy-5-deazariboflavin synthase subunit CofH n=1 Tax=Salinarchaeum sp. IM2453 TaxID=2862870 RepID=UPI001C8282D9|nr:7,8-didemethyl-8-hydroxy-5-deazariboflavin synthase subunit CofH [Salinarchaeum sp. IM2453]QZA89365.1 7,8-didemethyl-8-hydroxy-5-deazariboflavin synthase subunit CofH [Salinarchaeum sp. IM2453]
MADGFRLGVTVPELDVDIEYDHVPITDQSFENALERAKNKERLSVADGIELITTGTEKPGIDPERKAQVIDIANQRRAEIVGDEVTFVANLNNNITTVCDAGCLFCNFSTPSCEYRNADNPAGYTRTPAESRELVDTALDRGISEVTVASGLHPSLALDGEHKEILRNTDELVRYEPPKSYPDDPGTYTEQIDAISFDGLHVHGITPEEATHASRGTDWEYVDVYRRLADAGLDSVPGTAAEILVDEVRDVICSNKVSADDWMHAMEAAATAGLEITATILYGHIENAAHRVLHLQKIRRLQERTGSIREFIPLSFVHHNTPLYEQGYLSEGATPAEDELMVAVSRLFLDNIDHIQASWVKHGDGRSLNLLTCGADDYMGTLLSEEITKRAGGDHGEYRTFKDYVDMITSIGRIPVERSTDYRTRRRIDPDDPPFGPTIGPRADGSPIL